MKTYILDAHFSQLFTAFGINPGEVLRKAGLAEDLFSRSTPALSGSDYLALMDAVGQLAPSEDFAIRLATSDGVERFSPPIFAAYCAQNGQRCIERLAQHKPLTGPIRYRLETLGQESTLYIEADEPGIQIPTFLAEGELAFILHIIRSATKEQIQPLRAESVYPVSSSLEKLVGVPVEVTGVNAITFKLSDLQIPLHLPQ